MASQGLQLEDEFELEDENEDFLGNIGSILGKVSGLLGEGELEDEYEAEDEYEFEDEYEDEDEAEDFFGNIVSGISSLLGEGEYEEEYEDEDEAEQFFGGIGKWLKKAAPILKTIAKTAGPLVATAVGGPAAAAPSRRLPVGARTASASASGKVLVDSIDPDGVATERRTGVCGGLS
jgi:hypothetical protein